MNKFPWDCGECPLLRTYDMSIDDLTHICLWSKKQIDDCDKYKSAECPLEEHDARVREDAIENVFNILNKALKDLGHDAIPRFILDGVAVQLKEKR